MHPYNNVSLPTRNPYLYIPLLDEGFDDLAITSAIRQLPDGLAPLREDKTEWFE